MLKKELNGFKKSNLYFNAGENADSLFLENYSNFAKFLISYFTQTNNYLELRTKSPNLNSILNLPHNPTTIISFSFSNLSFYKNTEINTANIKERLIAAKKCSEAGYLLGIRLEPLFITKNYKKEITKLLDLIFSVINLNKIYTLSISLFRFTEKMRILAEKQNFYTLLYKEEFIKLRDKKYHYLKPTRVNFYSFVLHILKKKKINLPVYLTGETPQVWEIIFGKKVKNLSLIKAEKNLPVASKLTHYISS